MKKMISVLLIAMLTAGAITGCGSSDSSLNDDELLSTIPNYDAELGTFAKGPNGEEAFAAAELSMTDEQYAKAKDMNLKLAMLWAGTSEWYNGMTDGAMAECEKMGIEVLTVADAEFDPTLQATQIETTISLKPDIILSLPVDPVSGTNAFKAVVNSGISLVFADNSVNDYTAGEDYVAVCTGDQYGMGRTCADLIAEAVGDKGKIGIIYYDADYTVTNNRDNQFVRSVLENYPDIEIVSMMGFAEETATGEVASAMLTQNPDLDAIYCSWDVAAEPVVAEIRSSGRDIKVVTIDLGENNDLEMAKGGIVYGKSADVPYQIGGAMVKAAVLDLLGEEVSGYIVSDALKVTKDNLVDCWVYAMNCEPGSDILNALK